MNHLLEVRIHNVYLGQIEVKCDSVIWLLLDHVTLLTSFQTRRPYLSRHSWFDKLQATQVGQTAHQSGHTDCPPLRSHGLPTTQVTRTAPKSGHRDCPPIRSQTQVTRTAHHSGHTDCPQIRSQRLPTNQVTDSGHIDCPPLRSHRLPTTQGT